MTDRPEGIRMYSERRVWMAGLVFDKIIYNHGSGAGQSM